MVSVVSPLAKKLEHILFKSEENRASITVFIQEGPYHGKKKKRINKRNIDDVVNNNFQLDSITARETLGSGRMEPPINVNEAEEKSPAICNFILSIRQFIL